MFIRSFLALSLPDDFAQLLGDEASRLAYQDKNNNVRWVPEQNYHVTLAFLGDIELSQIDNLAAELDYFLQPHQVQLELSHLSPFPESSPKLIAGVLNKTESLLLVYEQTKKAIHNVGIKIEKRKFMPHITLGRFRTSGRRRQIISSSLFNVHAVANAVVLYESILTPNGAEYQAMYEFGLNMSPIS